MAELDVKVRRGYEPKPVEADEVVAPAPVKIPERQPVR